MKDANKTPIVILSDISISELDEIVLKFSLNQCNELWIINENKETIEWGINRNLAVTNLQNDPIRKFHIPNGNIVLPLAESFFYYKNYYFVYKAAISSDNCLLGAVFHLTKLLDNKKEYSTNFSEYLFELYLYFRESKFICINNSEFISGKGWDIDYAFIKEFNLSTGRKYKLFFRELIAPQITNYNILGLERSSVKFYPTGENLFYLIELLINPVSKFINSINILLNIFAFRWRRYKRRLSKS